MNYFNEFITERELRESELVREDYTMLLHFVTYQREKINEFNKSFVVKMFLIRSSKKN